MSEIKRYGLRDGRLIRQEAEVYFSEILPGIYEMTKSRYGDYGTLHTTADILPTFNRGSQMCAIESEGLIVTNFASRLAES